MDPHHHFPPGVDPTDHASAFAPFFGGLMFLLFLLLIAGTLFYLVRSGRLQVPSWNSSRTAPEFEARKILSERFARGDISAEEFMERASVLNWTPGVEPIKPKSKHRKHS